MGEDLRGGFLPSLVCLIGSTTARENAVSARLVIDSGAANSFLTKTLSKRAKLNEEKLLTERVGGIGGRVSSHKIFNVNCVLFSNIENEFYVKCRLKALDKICDDLPPVELPWEEIPGFSHLSITNPLPVLPYTVEILIGQDFLADILIGMKTVEAQGRKFIIWETKLGFALSGSNVESVVPLTSAVNTLTESNQELTDLWKRFWDTESIKDQTVILSPDEIYVVDHFNNNVKFNGQRYCVSLPFNPDKEKPTNNFGTAVAQFRSMERNLVRNACKGTRYTDAIEQYLEAGHAELVESTSPGTDKAYYLPHHAIWRDNHPSTKARIVFNGSAPDDNGFSLNDSLLPGPPLQPDLSNILISFRKHSTALVADISKMFLQIQIDIAQRDYLRFVWKRPGSDGPLKIYRKTVLPFGLNCAPYLAIQTVSHHLSLQSAIYPEATELVRQHIFVDDLLMSFALPDRLVQLRQEITTMMHLGGFDLAKWLSNDAELMKSIPTQDRAKAAPLVIAEKDMTLSPDAIPMTLGILWNPIRDVFEYQGALELNIPIAVETMRTLSSRAAKIFDPLGFLSPFIIIAKILMQECWKLQLKWDDPLPESILTPWLEWVHEITYLHYLEIPRTLFIQNAVSITLHGFSDASDRACAAAVYVKSVDASGSSLIHLVASKTTVAPIKLTTIPRLELMAALLTAQLTHKVAARLLPSEVYLWTDNTTTLQWIQKPPTTWKTFVGNRVAQIVELFPPSHWRHVPTHKNPADLPSRGLTAQRLLEMDEWFKGPSFLDYDEDCWPASPILSKEDTEANRELKPYIPFTLVTHSIQDDFFNALFDNDQLFWRNLRLLTYVRRFIANSRRSDVIRKTIVPGKKEISESMNVWVKFVQEEAFPDEIATLVAGNSVKVGKLCCLQPYLCKTTTLVKVGGRLQFSGLPEETVHPAILPAKNKYVERYLMAMHLILGHVGPETLLGHIRMKFWLLQGRREVKRVIRRCKCYRLKAKPFTQKIAPLPRGRTMPSFAFAHVGLDYAGPFEVLLDSKLTGADERFLKVWVLLITCFTTRAVHFEYVTSMDTSHFINALQRFIARRGHPTVITCDNATTYAKADRELKKLYTSLDWNKIQREMIQLPTQIEFRFNVPVAPHWGGVFERLVQSLKKSLRATLARQRASLEEFRTVLCNAEMIVNSRPLTSVSDDINDPLPITPAHLVLGRALQQIPDNLGKDDINTRIAVQWKERQRLTQEFWGRWRKEYLVTLQTSQKWLQLGHAPKIGEVVLMEDTPKSRMMWPIVAIKELHLGRDGLIRSASFFCKGKMFTRDLRHLYRLEGRSEEM